MWWREGRERVREEGGVREREWVLCFVKWWQRVLTNYIF